MIKMQYDFLDNEIPIFGLYGFNGEECECGRDGCDAAGKHPIASNWQHSPLWSDDQLETMEEMGQFDSGYGVLVNGLLIIDVDARNGGVKSFEKLCHDLDEDLLGAAGLAVATGSGAGSMHLYFKAPDKVSLLQHHDEYPGIDFKSSGFVVGPESRHVSGNTYQVIHGSPAEIDEAPESIIKKLKRPEYHRAKHNGETLDLTDNDIRAMLQYYSNTDLDYEEWIRCGMAIHDATNGAGYELWDEWSQKSDKYNPTMMEKKWHSFGKTSNPVTVGTLIHHARQNGWQSSYDEVTFDTDLVEDETLSGVVDLTRPPGFVGEVTKWVNSQCLYPREQLAVAAALTAVGNIVGLRHVDAMDGMTTNLISFCVAGSSTGKEAVQQAYMKIMRAAGIAGAVHGAFKSEQEVIRNLTRHQMAAYAVDELGITLKKIKNAQARGGASYLEGLIGVIMSAYSKANGYMPVSGDVREEIKTQLLKERAACDKKIDRNEQADLCERRIIKIDKALADLDNGIDSPFLSAIGFTTPVTFNDLMDYEQATNGFLARSVIFNDLETNPRRKSGFNKEPMTSEMEATLQQLYAMGEFDMMEGARIEYHGTKHQIQSDEDAAQLLDEVYEYFWQQAEQHKSVSGLEAVPRRGYEITAKVSTILAAAEGIRTAEHVRWAFALAKRDVDYKMKLAYANIKEEQEDKTDAVQARIMNCLTKDHGETLSVLVNRCRPHKKELVESCVKNLLEKGVLIEKETTASNGRKSVRYFES
ncbi:DNA primase [Idiomarinaceae phage Phi1M2-2]|uniref:DNA primase n=1 Tax=Idiomarinaceae phage Phi1M2-2 TaxID=1527515 RepID=UPI0004F5E9DC|nr:DNA primase [Idiomarinaceae phage Phi1M2-2]AIM40821.1 putative bifunctional DNA primase/polymerase [Idiomarinaceae phage Phi1M2-2]